ncbi:MAG: hypothetical protein FJ320_02335 [SAR202 cluster bacterium]|nr:hypothetical protein [SAR202 cluster bacterium]
MREPASDSPNSPDTPQISRPGDTNLRVVRMLRVYRPLARVLQFSAKPFPRPRAIGVMGVVVGFALLILIGTLLLSLPQARAPGRNLDLLDAFFTATSAVCVTGLVVQDTGTYWTGFGQGVILALIQLGGLGVMTATMFVLVIFRRPVSLKDTFEVHEMSRAGGVQSVTRLLWLTILLTLAFEALGAFALWVHFRDQFPGGAKAFGKVPFTPSPLSTTLTSILWATTPILSPSILSPSCWPLYPSSSWPEASASWSCWT